MRKIALLTAFVTSLSIGLPYYISGRWWVMLICILVGILWYLPSRYTENYISTLSLFILSGIGALGIFFGQSHFWSLTNFVLLLITWDIDHYTRVFKEFEKDQTTQNTASALFYSHLKRLGLIAVIGWFIGMVALNIQVQINFTLALLLVLLMTISLRQVSRYIINLQN